MKMNVTFENIADQSDASTAAALMMALEDAFKLADGSLVTAQPHSEQPTQPPVQAASEPAPVAPAKRRGGRKPGSKNKAKPEVTVVAVEALPVQEDVAEAPSQPELPLSNGHDEPDEPIETARERFLVIAREHGAAWLRPVLEERGVTRLSELSDDHVRELLRATT